MRERARRRSQLSISSAGKPPDENAPLAERRSLYRKTARGHEFALPVAGSRRRHTPLRTRVHRSSCVAESIDPAVSRSPSIQLRCGVHRSSGVAESIDPAALRSPSIQRCRGVHRSSGVAESIDPAASRSPSIQRCRGVHRSSSVAESIDPAALRSPSISRCRGVHRPSGVAESIDPAVSRDGAKGSLRFCQPGSPWGDPAAVCWKLRAERNFPPQPWLIQKKRPRSPFCSTDRLIADPGLPIPFNSVGT